MTQKHRGEERVNLFRAFSDHTISPWEITGEGARGGKQEAGTEAEATEESVLWLAQPAFFCSSGPPCSGLALPPVGWAF